MTTEHTIYEHTFTPEQAKEIVDATIAAQYNFRNAAPQNTHVQKLAQAMRSGRWTWTDSPPIRLSHDWQLASDGLHRLTACAASGVPLRALVLVGERWRAELNADRGKARTIAQYMAHEGVAHATLKAAAVRTHMAREIARDRGIAMHFASNVVLQEQDMIDFAKKWDSELDWCAARSGTAPDRGLNATGYAVFLFEAASVDHDLAGEFHADLIGVTESVDDPIARLRAYANKRYQASGKRLAQVPTIDALVKCWDLRMAGERLKMWKQPVWDDIRFPSGYAGHFIGSPEVEQS